MRRTLRAFLERFSVDDATFAALAGVSLDDLAVMVAEDDMVPLRVRAVMSLFSAAPPAARAIATRYASASVTSGAWQIIRAFPAYEVSSDGRVRRAVGGPGTSALRVLKATPNARGYLRVTLYDASGRMRTMAVHQLVCAAFHGDAPADRPFACHRNGVKRDCSAGNLYWGSPADNAADTAVHRQAETGGLLGDKPSLRTVRRLFRDKKISLSQALTAIDRRSNDA